MLNIILRGEINELYTKMVFFTVVVLLSIETIIPAPNVKREVSLQNLQMSGKVWLPENVAKGS